MKNYLLIGIISCALTSCTGTALKSEKIATAAPKQAVGKRKPSSDMCSSISDECSSEGTIEVGECEAANPARDGYKSTRKCKKVSRECIYQRNDGSLDNRHVEVLEWEVTDTTAC